MATLREIKKKIVATKSIGKTTKAMQMIASAQFQKAQRQLFNSKPYAEKIRLAVSDILKKTETIHPFLTGGTSSREGLLFITSEKGLCGSYNTNIVKKLLEHIKIKGNKGLDIFVIGKKGRDYLKRNGIKAYREYFDTFRKFSSGTAEIIADEIVEYFTNTKPMKFSILYAEYKTLFYQPIVSRQLLPVERPAEPHFGSDYIYEPGKEIILDRLLKRYIRSAVFRVLVEAYTSEIVSRRNAMENANRNCNDILDELSLNMNKLRQQQITTELTELVSGGAE